MNSAHPYENPTPLVDALQKVAMLLFTASVTYTFGTMLSRRRQGWVFFAVFMVLLIGSVTLVYSAERYGNPLLTQAGADQALTADQSGGSMEGKEVRFGIAQSSPLYLGNDRDPDRLGQQHARLADPVGGLVAPS